MSRPAVLLALLTLCAAPATAAAQPTSGGRLPASFAKHADVTVEVVPAKAKIGETVTVRLTVVPKNGYHTYPASPPNPMGPDTKNVMEPPKPGDLVFIEPAKEKPASGWKEKPGDDGITPERTSTDPVTWEFKAVVSPLAKSGPKAVVLEPVFVQVCDKTCLTVDGSKLPPAQFVVEEGAGNTNAADLALARAILKLPPEPGAPAVVPLGPIGRSADNPERPSAPPSTGTAKGESRKDAKPTDVYAEELKAIAANVVTEEAPGTGGGADKTGLWAFVLTAAVWGLISLVTPCVFPMIPITVSIFLKQADGSLRERLKLAGVYSLTIITVLGVSAFALLKFMAWLSTQPATNFLLAAIFVVLALSLFGMYEIALPNVIQKRLQARQAKGGTIGTIFGALAFTVISFTCVAPFLGGFAGISAGSSGGSESLIAVPTWKEIAGGFAFATAFAAPFFVLALVPGLMKALPKSGGWLDSVKVVMGFLELAAALKFLRNAELGLLPTTQYFTYDLVLGGWVAISAACGLYLLNLYRLPHDEEKPNIGVPRLLFALMFLGLALYLMPALFKGPDGKSQRPAGAVYAWVEAFLLPEGGEEGWSTDLKETIETAKKSRRPILVDFTGVNCSNCKLNERDVFPKPAVQEEFQKFERVKLYTDWTPGEVYKSDPGLTARKAEGRANGDFQLAVFKDIKLPLYAVFVPLPGGKLKLIGTYEEGKINDTGKFVEFLKDTQAKAKK
jgi:thiol:disulfide interchange protein